MSDPASLSQTDGTPPTDDHARQLAKDYARTFSGRAGEAVLAHLESLTTGRVMGPEASDALLRHVEGQRALVAGIRSLIRRGRAG